MKQRPIKIVKRGEEIRSSQPPTADEILVQQKKEDEDDKRDMTKAIKGWIDERRENSKAEETYSNNILFDNDPGSNDAAG